MPTESAYNGAAQPAMAVTTCPPCVTLSPLLSLSPPISLSAIPLFPVPSPHNSLCSPTPHPCFP